MVATVVLIRRFVNVLALLIPFMVVAIGMPAAFAASLRIPTDLPANRHTPSSNIQTEAGLRLGDEDRSGPSRVAASTLQTVTVDVSPQVLIANSGATAQITVTAVDSASQPITNVLFNGILSPTSLGSLSGLAATDANGQSFGTWTVGNAIGSGVLSIGDGSVTGTASLTASVGSLATVTVSPTLVTVTVGGHQAFIADGLDLYGNSVVATPMWTTNGGSIDDSGWFTATTTAASGRLITATQASVSGTAVVNVTAGPPARLVISPSTAVISAGLRVTYTAIAYDAYDNFIGDVTTGTLFNLTPPAGGVFEGNAVTPTIKNAYHITGTYGSISSTAMLTVTPAALSRLAIENAPAGMGSPIGDTLLSVYDTLTAYAAGYDAYDNLIAAVPAAWEATALLAGRLSPTTGISTVLTPAPVLTGSGVISAAYTNFVTATGLITVQVPITEDQQNCQS